MDEIQSIKLERINQKLIRELGTQVMRFLNDKSVIEIMLNPDGDIWIEKIGEKMKKVSSMPSFASESLLATIASSLGTIVNRDNPIVEGELPLDGSRFEGLLPPVVQKPVFTIRKRATKIFSLNDYVKDKTMSLQQLDAINCAIRDRKNILVVGGTGSGKTTLTNAIIDQISKLSPEHRLVLIEDTAEIQCASKNYVTLRANEAVDMTKLLKATMRLRPDRIIVGEVRGAEALSLLKAWNTGHPGGIATVHANSVPGGLIRMEQLLAEAGALNMSHLIAEAIDLIIVIDRSASGRNIREIASVSGFDGEKYLTSSILVGKKGENHGK